MFALAALLAFQAVGWFLTWSFLHFEIRTIAHAAVQRQETPVKTATIPTALFSKIRVGKKEILLEGRLYDIVSQKIADDSVVLTLYHDQREEAMLDTLGNLLRPSDNPQHLPLQNWLAKWLGSVFISLRTLLVVLSEPAFSNQFFSYLLPVAQGKPGCLSPPPKSISVGRA